MSWINCSYSNLSQALCKESSECLYLYLIYTYTQAQINLMILAHGLMKFYCPFETGHSGLVTCEFTTKDGNYLPPPPLPLTSFDSLRAGTPASVHGGEADTMAMLLTQLKPALNIKSY